MSRQFRSTVKDELRRVLDECEEIRLEYRGRDMPGDVFADYKRKAERATLLADAIDDKRAKERWKVSSRTDWEREIPPEQASRIPASKSHVPSDCAGYVSLPDAIAMSAALEQYLEAGAPRAEMRLFSTGTKALVQVGGEMYLPITKAERDVIQAKALPTLGTGVIEPTRLPIMPRVTEDQRLRLRDALVMGRTSSDSVSFLREESYTVGAAYQLAGSVKGESTANYTLQTAAVQTIAVWIPVLVQQLADMGQLRALLSGRLEYDIRLREENEILYGVGGPNAFEGLLTITGSHDIATVDARITTPTIIDSIKVGATEVRVAGFEPDVLLIHPYDWEAVLLEKGTDDHYLSQVFPTTNGGFRVHGLTVIETAALETSTGERNLLVLDSKRAAFLWLREDLNVQIGMADDDFIRNKRRLLAEERCAFGVVSPAAVAVFQTDAGS